MVKTYSREPPVPKKGNEKKKKKKYKLQRKKFLK